jgi:hypothetical protein
MKKVIRLTESELTNLIHRIIVETEMDMDRDMMKDGEMDEAWYSFLTRTMGDEDDFEDSLKIKMRNYEYLTGRRLSREEKEQMMNDLRSEAKEDGFAGELKFKGPKGEKELVYVSGRDAEDRSGFVGFN